MIEIDGSQGEGGGQIIRTALALSGLTGRAVRIDNIRARRRTPGLAPQHLAGVQALAQITDAEVTGAEIGSTALTWAPRRPLPGRYTFDVAEAAKGGSAGSTSLLFQTVWLPLALAPGASHLRLRGGTHVAWSPSYHYLDEVYLTTVARMGFAVSLRMNAWGFYPVGGGEIEASIAASDQPLSPLTLIERGDLVRVQGVAVAAELPAHIAQRIANRAMNVLQAEKFPVQITPQRVKSAGPGAGVFLVAQYEQAVAGFSALGARGKPSEQVADEACQDLLRHHASGKPVDPHLADQLLLPLALAPGVSTFRTSYVTQHLLTNGEVIRRFLPVRIEIEGAEGEAGVVRLVAGG